MTITLPKHALRNVPHPYAFAEYLQPRSTGGGGGGLTERIDFTPRKQCDTCTITRAASQDQHIFILTR